MSKKTLFMETTTIDPTRTAGEIMSLLVQCGASQIATTYQNGVMNGLRWIMRVNGIEQLFEMPARVDPIFNILNGRRKYSWDRTQKAADDRIQAERVAWRQLLRWVQAQTAMIQTGMVCAEEVYTAYWIPPGTDRTLFQHLVESQFKALPAPSV